MSEASAIGRLARVLEKPPRVIAFRAAQEAALLGMRLAAGWPRLAGRIARWWDGERVDRLVAQRRQVVVARDATTALRAAFDRGLIDREALLQRGRAFAERDFEIFGASVPLDGAWPWHTDWRWHHTWRPRYFRDYDLHHPDREAPYDVKAPWELSRLWFLQPIAQGLCLGPDRHQPGQLTEVLLDWEGGNPLAHSVAWDPMEASMRGIGLVVLLDMLLAVEISDARLLGVLLRLLCAHAEFVSRTLEYTDVRNNHYAANLTALTLIGLAVECEYPRAKRWLRSAAERVAREIELQFLPDGVNFEKSVAYHRLTLELFLLAAIALERAGQTFPATARDRLHAAARYSAACVRPDGLTPNVGDTDDARLLSFDPAPPRDHRPLLAATACLFRDPVLKGAAERFSAAAAWLLGGAGLAAWDELAAAPPPEHLSFPAGGIVTARRGSNYLWLDVGEVGLQGRGGHGHNDLLSFELVLAGKPLIVDPGSFVYTADARARDLFRGTRYHNGLAVDGLELAPLQGMWRIGNDARPTAIEVRRQGSETRAQAGHEGYHRLPDPVHHVRRLRFDRRTGELDCVDRLSCGAPHRVERFLHLDPGVGVEAEAGGARLRSGDHRWYLRWDPEAQLTLEDGWVSPGYAVRQTAPLLVLTNQIDRACELRLSLVPDPLTRVDQYS